MTTSFNYVNNVDASIVALWDRVAATCANPLGITEEMVMESLEKCPPKEFRGGTFRGRYIIPRQFVRYNIEDQPRDKSNDQDHVNDLVNNYSVSGVLLDCPPPIATFDRQDTDLAKLAALAGFNRNEALGRLGQEVYIFDLYDFESRYWEIVARNESNHHSNPQLSQSIPDYIKEVSNAVNEGIVERSEEAITEFVDLIATDKTYKAKKKIRNSCFNNCQVFANFRVYNSSGTGENTLNGFMKKNGLAKQGIENRTEQELLAQGYLTYCAGDGDAINSWMRGIFHATRLGIPVWIFGYSTKRVPDIATFRKQYDIDFGIMKERLIQFASNISGESIGDVDEDAFPVKFAGFLPQYVKPNPQDNGRETEHSLVDMFGNALRFDQDGDCLTLRDDHQIS